MPYSSAKDPSGGILVMIAKAAFDAAGRDTTVTLLPWARALEDARLIVADFNSGLRLISANAAMRRILAAYGVNP